MPALLPTEYYATVRWLGLQRRPVENLQIFGEPVERLDLRFDGPQGEIHGGVNRPSCSRVLAQHPRNTTIRNVRQLCIVSVEEMADVAAELGLSDFDYAWVGASIALEGISDFTHIPPSSRLQGPDGVTLVVDMENLPCQEPAVTIAQATGGLGKQFKSAAKDRRGVTAWVEREGVLRPGDRLRLHVPGQRAWAPGLPLTPGA